MGLATYGLFIQVVSLCKFETLESVFNRSIRLHVLFGDWCKTDEPTNVNHSRLIKGFLMKVSPQGDENEA